MPGSKQVHRRACKEISAKSANGKFEEVIFQKRVRGFHRVSKREKHLKPRARGPSGFIVFERLET